VRANNASTRCELAYLWQFVELEICLRSIVQPVPREIGRHRHVEVDVAMADVALQEMKIRPTLRHGCIDGEDATLEAR
jgi:hypothetical protein